MFFEESQKQKVHFVRSLENHRVTGIGDDNQPGGGDMPRNDPTVPRWFERIQLAHHNQGWTANPLETRRDVERAEGIDQASEGREEFGRATL